MLQDSQKKIDLTSTEWLLYVCKDQSCITCSDIKIFLKQKQDGAEEEINADEGVAPQQQQKGVEEGVDQPSAPIK